MQATRRPIVAGNWKMHTTPAEGIVLARAVLDAGLPTAEVDVVLCPPALGLVPLASVLAETPLRLGAQNVHWEDQGAVTGEISPAMLIGIAEFAIVGHSERRAMFGDTDATVNRKIKTILAHELTPIMCLGESLEQRDAGRTRAVVTEQTTAGLAGVTTEQAAGTVIAYEPIWAIGTGRNATPAQAEEAIGWIRDQVERDFGRETAAALRIQYGGSVNSGNCVDILSRPGIDGALVGGASLRAEDFVAIVRAAAG